MLETVPQPATCCSCIKYLVVIWAVCRPCTVQHFRNHLVSDWNTKEFKWQLMRKCSRHQFWKHLSVEQTTEVSKQESCLFMFDNLSLDKRRHVCLIDNETFLDDICRFEAIAAVGDASSLDRDALRFLASPISTTTRLSSAWGILCVQTSLFTIL